MKWFIFSNQFASVPKSNGYNLNSLFKFYKSVLSNDDILNYKVLNQKKFQKIKLFDFLKSLFHKIG